jgi:cytochrome c-type biogenesis protein CcmF
MRAHGESFSRALVAGQLGQGRRRFGAYVVHLGAAVVVVAIAVSSTMSTHKELQLRPGEEVQLGRYTLRFLRTERLQEPHREALVAHVALRKDGRDLGTMRPRMNQYERQREPIGTPDVRSFLMEDVYLSVLNVDAGGGSLGLLALINPMVGWIWGATALMALGGLLALVPRRGAGGAP